MKNMPNKSKPAGFHPDFLRQPKDFTKDGQCSRCAGCCSSSLPVTPAELKAMKAYADKIGYVPKLPDKKDCIYLMCPFLKQGSVLEIKRTCAIYDARPEICRAFICNKTNGEIQQAYTRQTNGIMPPKSVNVWQLYNHTGLRKNGKDILYDQAPVVQLEDDFGRKIQLQVGQPVNILTESGKYMHSFMCVGLLEDAIQIASENGVQTINYTDIKSITV